MKGGAPGRDDAPGALPHARTTSCASFDRCGYLFVTGRRANVAFARPVFADNIDLMLSGTCAFCGNQTHFTARTGRVVAELTADRFANYRFEIAATCDACQRFNVAVGDREASRSITFKPNQMLDVSRATDEGEAMTITSWSPPSMRPVNVEFIPDGVAGYLKEAHDAYSVGAYRAVLLLVRSVIEATAKDRGVTSGNLVAKINQLQTDGHIRKGTKDMAHALRILGNDMAHGDIEDVPTNEDANDALIVARFVLDDVYVADARRIDMLARRGGGS